MTVSYCEIGIISIILMLPFLYETSSVFRYYFKFFFYYTFFMIMAVALIPIMAFKPCDVRNVLLAATIGQNVTNILGVRWHLRGREYLEKEQACIIVANHQSSLDVVGMIDIWHIMDKCTVVAKKELFYVWPFGIAAWLCGLIFIDRVKTEKARDVLKKSTDYIKKEKIKLWVFPEGTRRNTGDVHLFKKGAFHMAVSAQIPVLPVVFSSYYFLDRKEKRFDNGKVIITTLPPISTEGLTTDNVNDLMQQTRDKMLETFHATTKEVKDELLEPLETKNK